VIGISLNAQLVRNTSYTNQSGERVLRLESELPIDISTAWKYFTQDEKIKMWMAPLAHIELKSGGYIVTNYDKTKSLSDSTSIVLPIIAYIDNELLILKVNLNNNFPKSARDTDEHLQEIIQFIKTDENHTNIISSMTGWGNSSDWDKTYSFFTQGNESVFTDLQNCLKQ
jgi:uncharacterized protein YndB with AHSA1/START domain